MKKFIISVVLCLVSVAPAVARDVWVQIPPVVVVPVQPVPNPYYQPPVYAPPPPYGYYQPVRPYYPPRVLVYPQIQYYNWLRPAPRWGYDSRYHRR